MFVVTPFGFFLFGAITMVCAVIGLYFYKYYRRTGDRLLLLFAVAFWLMSLERLLLMGTPQEYEARSAIYVIRLLAFILIIVAIVDKNRASKGGGSP
ncbi:MAG: hypothetical protein KF865_09770 [Bdellovibrionaceae bacterium]|nr:hypothetical protein [Pseudobdellovibrionaceae bacterium]